MAECPTRVELFHVGGRAASDRDVLEVAIVAPRFQVDQKQSQLASILNETHRGASANLAPTTTWIAVYNREFGELQAFGAIEDALTHQGSSVDKVRLLSGDASLRQVFVIALFDAGRLKFT